MAELGATEDPAALGPGDPVVLRTAGATYRRYAQMLGDAATGLGRIGTPEGWSGPAADGFRSAFALEPQRWQDAAAAFGEAARAVGDHAGAIDWARGRAGEAILRWQEAQATSITARARYDETVAAGAAPVPFVDPGEDARADAQAILAQAREHVRDSGDAAAGVVTAACTGAPAAPGFWGELADGAGAVAAGLGNASASLGNALLDHPANVAAMLGGGALAGLSAVGVAGSIGVTATGVGAPVGAPLGALSATGVATGAAIAGLGAADTVQHALTDDRVAPFRVAADADAGDDAPLSPADRLTTVGVPGGQERVRELPDEQAIENLYDELTEGGGTPVEWNGYRGVPPLRLEDGTEIGLRQSTKHGSTIDIKLPNGEQWKVHIPR
ncbi:putative T7SS-secreted protein [Actinomycetospora succinea]